MGFHHSPHTHPTPIPMGIPIPTAALQMWQTPHDSIGRAWAQQRTAKYPPTLHTNVAGRYKDHLQDVDGRTVEMSAPSYVAVAERCGASLQRSRTTSSHSPTFVVPRSWSSATAATNFAISRVHHPSLLHSFTPSSKPTFSTNPSHLRLLLPTGLPSWQWDWTGPITLII